MQLGFAEVGVKAAQPLDLGDQTRVVLGLVYGVGSTRTGGQGRYPVKAPDAVPDVLQSHGAPFSRKECLR